MVSPAVIAGFAVIDASVLGQAFYAVRSWERHHEDQVETDVDPRRRAPSPTRPHGRA